MRHQHSTFIQRSWIRRVSLHINWKKWIRSSERRAVGAGHGETTELYWPPDCIDTWNWIEYERERIIIKEKKYENGIHAPLRRCVYYAFSDLFTCTVLPVVVCLFVSFSCCGVSTAHLALGSLMVSRHNTEEKEHRGSSSSSEFLVLSIAAGLKSFGGTNRRNPKTLTRARPSPGSSQPYGRVIGGGGGGSSFFFSLSTAHLLLLTTTTTRLPI